MLINTLLVLASLIPFFVLIVSFEPGSLILFNKCLLLQVQVCHYSPAVFLHIIHYYLLSITYIKIQDVNWYPSFSDMLAAEGLAKVLTGVKTIKEGKSLLLV